MRVCVCVYGCACVWRLAHLSESFSTCRCWRGMCASVRVRTRTRTRTRAHMCACSCERAHACMCARARECARVPSPEGPLVLGLGCLSCWLPMPSSYPSRPRSRPLLCAQARVCGHMRSNHACALHAMREHPHTHTSTHTHTRATHTRTHAQGFTSFCLFTDVHTGPTLTGFLDFAAL